MKEKINSDTSVVKNITIHEPLSRLNIDSLIHRLKTSLWKKNFPTSNPTTIAMSHINTFRTDHPPGGYLHVHMKTTNTVNAVNKQLPVVDTTNFEKGNIQLQISLSLSQALGQ